MTNTHPEEDAHHKDKEPKEDKVVEEVMSGKIGIFIGGNHYKTCANERIAQELATKIGTDCTVRELTLDEYYDRWREILKRDGYL